MTRAQGTPLPSHPMSTARAPKMPGTDHLKQAYREFLVEHRSPQAMLCRGGLRIYAPSHVYHPHPNSSSQFMLAHLPEIRNARVLDMGTGTGIIGLYLAAPKFRNTVTLADIDPAACAAAEINAMVNERWAKVIKADVWRGLPQERYDVIIWNLPLLDRPIKKRHDVIACDPSGTLTRRFLDGLARHTTRTARAYILTSSQSAPRDMRRPGWNVRSVAEDHRRKDMHIELLELTKREK